MRISPVFRLRDPRHPGSIGKAAAWLLVAATTWIGSVRAEDAQLRLQLREGETTWELSQRYLENPERWLDLVRLNGFEQPRKLAPGTVVRIPRAWLRRTPASLTVDAVHGAVSIVSSDGHDSAAMIGHALFAGVHVKTGSQSSVMLRAPNGSRILVRSESEIALVRASVPIDIDEDRAPVTPSGAGENSDFEINVLLIKGAIENVVQQWAPTGRGRFEIRTPAGVAAVRGTEFRVSGDDAVTRSEVLAGAVQLSNRSGGVRLNPGQGTRMAVGKRPEAASPLLAAPSLQGVAPLAERVPVDLPLTPVRGATAYRTQVAADDSFRVLLSDELSAQPRLRAPDLPDGEYFVRVRAVDARQLEGLSAESPMRIHARPEPPMTSSPGLDASVAQSRPLFQWTRLATGARKVRLQVAQTADFAAPLVDVQQADDGALQPEAELALGEYHWRIAAVDPQIGQGPWSDVLRFRRVVPAPGLAEPESGAGGVNLRWRDQPAAARYRVQVARESAFGEPIFDEMVDGQTVQVPRPAPGQYFVRVQAEGRDGVVGPWGEPQQFSVDAENSRWQWLLLLVPFLVFVL